MDAKQDQRARYMDTVARGARRRQVIAKMDESDLRTALHMALSLLDRIADSDYRGNQPQEVKLAEDFMESVYGEQLLVDLAGDRLFYESKLPGSEWTEMLEQREQIYCTRRQPPDERWPFEAWHAGPTGDRHFISYGETAEHAVQKLREQLALAAGNYAAGYKGSD